MQRVLCLIPLALAGLAPAPAFAQSAGAIERAIRAGVGYLKRTQLPDGHWSYSGAGSRSGNDVGVTALAAVTLIESGVSPEHSAVRKAAAAIRKDIPTLTHTYSLALCIMFLDRLREESDEKRIHIMGMRLIAGQTSSGGWTYDCPILTPQQYKQMSGQSEENSSRKKSSKEGEEFPEVAAAQPAAPLVGGHGDNSNTQFALLGLWVARRHGVPSEQALRLVGKRFYDTQSPQDGGWSYAGSNSTPAMTCAGLLGIGARYATSARPATKRGRDMDVLDSPGLDHEALNRDSAVRRAKSFLAARIAAANRVHLTNPPGQGDALGDLYCLWSLERVAVVYDWTTIGGKDWYRWGATLLLAGQNADGSWRSSYPGPVDTSFALLFLNKSNFIVDLRARLQGVTRLKSGDVVEAKPKPTEPEKNESAAKTPEESLFREVPPLLNKAAKPAEEPAKTTDAIPSDPDEEAATRLGEELLKAAESRRKEIIKTLQESKGGFYTEALVDAIPKVEPAIREQARQALAERLSRMTAKTLRAYLDDENAELRRAAARAVALKEAGEHTPDLIELLYDEDPSVVNQARESLKKLTRLDFGPVRGASEKERAMAIDRWRRWWKTKGSQESDR